MRWLAISILMISCTGGPKEGLIEALDRFTTRQGIVYDHIIDNKTGCEYLSVAYRSVVYLRNTCRKAP